MTVDVSAARPDDAAQIADVFIRSRAVLTFLPDLHSAQEQAAFVRDVVCAQQAVSVARVDRGVAGFVATLPGWVEHLYVDPAHLRCGLGHALMGAAKAGGDVLRLWCFQQNTGALAFYQREGFTEIERTNGAGNMERCPDVLLEWRRASGK